MISLVMATYNGGKYLREQLDSIYNQTLLPDEVIVVDDCSKDNTVDILQEYAEKYGLKYYQNKNNSGVNKTFERAISLSSGDYISICDQDDVWIQYKIETLYNKIREIEEDKPACVSSRCIDVNKELKVLYNKKYNKGNSTFEEVLYSNASQGCTMMFNKKLKEVVLPLSPHFIYDHYIGIIACFIGHRYVINQPLMYYRHHGNNVVASSTHNYRRGLSEAIALYNIMKKKERFYLLNHIKNMIVDDEKKEIYFESLRFFSFKNNNQMIYNVFSCSYLSWCIKLFFLVYTCVVEINNKRQVESMKEPVDSIKEYR